MDPNTFLIGQSFARFIFIQDYVDNGIVLADLKIQQFIMIRRFVPVN